MSHTQQQCLHRVMWPCRRGGKLLRPSVFLKYRVHQIYIAWTTFSRELQGTFVSLFLLWMTCFFREVLTLIVAGSQYWFICTTWSHTSPKTPYVLRGSRLRTQPYAAIGCFIVGSLFCTASVSVSRQSVTANETKHRFSKRNVYESLPSEGVGHQVCHLLPTPPPPPPLRFSPIPLWKGKNRTGRKKEKKTHENRWRIARNLHLLSVWTGATWPRAQTFHFS